MTNKERWDSYTSNLCSPQSYLDWAFRFVIASSLQRRVAYNGDPMHGIGQLFPNMYVVLVGRAGVGKGVAINPALDLLKYHKKKDVMQQVTEQASDNEILLASSIDRANLDAAEEAELKMKRGGEKIDPPLFPHAPDATTYEKLVEDMSNSFRRINYPTTSSEGKEIMGMYGHCSMFFGLPELGSLLRKRTEDTVNFLLGLYDTPLDYIYKTKTQKSDRVRRGCLNLLAGTTPDFMESIFNQNLIDQGFSSRTFFIYASKNRKNVFSPEQPTSEQLQHRLDLLKHIKELARLYGEIKVDVGTKRFLADWWDNEENNRHLRPNISPKLDPYYARKNIHTIKVAIANHFMESTSLFIPKECFEQAIIDLRKEEPNMHLALTFASDNPLSKVTDKILDYIRGKKETSDFDLNLEFWRQLPNGKNSLVEVLRHLIGADLIEEVTTTDAIGRAVTKYVSIKQKE